MQDTHRKKGRKPLGKRRVNIKLSEDGWSKGTLMAKQDRRSFSNWLDNIILKEAAAEALKAKP